MSAKPNHVGRVPSHGAAPTGRKKPVHVGRLPSTGVPTIAAALGHASHNTSDGDAGSGDPAYNAARSRPVGRVPSRGASPERAKKSGERGGLGKAHQLFGEQLPKLLDELNEVLAA